MGFDYLKLFFPSHIEYIMLSGEFVFKFLPLHKMIAQQPESLEVVSGCAYSSTGSNPSSGAYFLIIVTDDIEPYSL